MTWRSRRTGNIHEKMIQNLRWKRAYKYLLHLLDECITNMANSAQKEIFIFFSKGVITGKIFFGCTIVVNITEAIDKTKKCPKNRNGKPWY